MRILQTSFLVFLLQSERGGQEIWGQHSAHVQSLGDIVNAPEIALSQMGEEEKPPVRIIPETPLQPVQSPLPPPSKQKHLVKVSAHFPKSVEHDFVANK